MLDGLVWPRNRLLPIAPGVFEAEAWPLSLTILDAGGEVRSMRIDGPQVGHLNSAGTYKKVRQHARRHGCDEATRARTLAMATPDFTQELPRKLLPTRLKGAQT